MGSERAASKGRDFWALREVDLSIERGEILGLIGPNGSGKSTLLQIICDVIPPTSGRVLSVGRKAALLELGAGFNPEFTGRENVLLNGEMMGLPREQVEASFSDVEQFAGIGQFIDRPVKEYSSGMYVRLAFSAAIHVSPDILIVDEALAVGDAAFASRCMRKLEQLRQSGITIVFVSHDLGLIKRLCHRAVLIADGQIRSIGDPNHVVNRYVALVQEREPQLELVSNPDNHAAHIQRHGDRTSEITDVILLGPEREPTTIAKPGDMLIIRAEVLFHQSSFNPVVGFLIRDRLGIDVYGTNTQLQNLVLGAMQLGNRIAVELSFPCQLTSGDYTITAATQHEDGASQDWRDDYLNFRVVDPTTRAGLVDLGGLISWTKLQSSTG